MFDIGFWELVTITLIALLIIGPEKLPKFAQDAGQFIGKLRNYINTAKIELKRELQLDQIDQLNENIDHIDRLMKDAPDRLIKDTESSEKANKLQD